MPDGVPKYICCGCDTDMTAAVTLAFQERQTTATFTVPGSWDSPSVTLQCPKGHWCNYARA